MTYKELVDDIQLQFKSHNESIKTQNPYWILFRAVTEIDSIRDELLQKIQSEENTPEWLITTSAPIVGVVSNSGGISGVFDDFKFAMFKIPDAYPIFKARGVLDVLSAMRQRKIYLETPEQVMLRIRAEDDSLKFFSYGFLESEHIYVYPFVNKIYIKFIPRLFCPIFTKIVVSETINAPEMIISEARKRVLESVMIQKQMPEDNWADQEDNAERNPQRQNRQ